MNKQLEEKLKKLPASPGVYFHKSDTGEIIYVGKAAVLRNRVRQYFQDSRSKDNKTIALVREIHDTDWVETESEVDALFLESEMVKRYMPRYNILLRDDKSQMYVRITMKDEFPTIGFTRNPSDDGAEYYGPFYNGFALKKALRYLRRIFPYYIDAPRLTKRPSLSAHIGLEPHDMSSFEYKSQLRQLISYIRGNRTKIMADLEKSMKQYAKQQDFESAAHIRNQLHALGELKRRITFGDKEFLDISKDVALADLKDLFGLADIPKRIEGYDISHMSGTHVVASMVVCTNGVTDRSEYRKFKVLEKNDDVHNIAHVIERRFIERNIKQWGMPDLVLIDGGKGQLDAALQVLQSKGITVPTISIAKRDEEIVINAELSGIDTTVLQQYLAGEKHDNGVYVSRSHAHYVVNLHSGQVNASSHSGNLRASHGPTARYSHITKLFQRIRDESHRFAITYQTSLRRTAQTRGILDDIPGIGPVTRRKLIRAFGSARGVMAADESQLVVVVGEKTARTLRTYLRQK